MGLLDKAKQAAQQAQSQLSGATGGMAGAQQGKVADTWLKELGQWVYADRMGRDPRAAAEIEVRIQQIQSWEQQNGTQVPLPHPAPGTAPGGPVVGAPSSIPGTMSEPAPIPGTFSEPAPIPGTLSGAPETPPAPGIPTPGGSLGPMGEPPSGEPMTPAPPSASPPPPPPPAPPSPPSPPGAPN